MNPFEQAVCNAALSDQSSSQNRELVAFWIRYQERDIIPDQIQPFVIPWPPTSSFTSGAPLDPVNASNTINEPATNLFSHNSSTTNPPSITDPEIITSILSDVSNLTKSAAPDQTTPKLISRTISPTQITTAHTHRILPSPDHSQPSQISFHDADFIISEIADSRSSLKLISESICSTPTKAQTKTAYCTNIQHAIHNSQPSRIIFQRSDSAHSAIVDFSTYSDHISASDLMQVSPAPVNQNITYEPTHFSQSDCALPGPFCSTHPHHISLPTQSLISVSALAASTNSSTPFRIPVQAQPLIYIHDPSTESIISAKFRIPARGQTSSQIQIQTSANTTSSSSGIPARDQVYVSDLNGRAVPTTKASKISTQDRHQINPRFHQLESLPPEFSSMIVSQRFQLHSILTLWDIAWGERKHETII